MKRIVSIICLLCSIEICYTRAQIALPDSVFELISSAKIMQLDEFMTVFNSHEPIYQIEKEDSLLRQRHIFRLVNHEMGKLDKTRAFREIMEFANTIHEDSIYLNFDDSTWFAEVDCNVLFEGKMESLTLILKTEMMEKFVYKWAICGAKGNLLRLSVDTIGKYRIPPVANELNFMYLSTMTDKNHAPYIANYKAKNISVCPFSVFLALVWSGNLKIVSTKRVRYHFLQVPNYVFTVSYFARENINSGWLIDCILKTTEEEKYRYTNHLLFE